MFGGGGQPGGMPPGMHNPMVIRPPGAPMGMQGMQVPAAASVAESRTSKVHSALEECFFRKTPVGADFLWGRASYEDRPCLELTTGLPRGFIVLTTQQLALAPASPASGRGRDACF